MFSNCVVVEPFNRVITGLGGDGAPALSTGGLGANSRVLAGSEGGLAYSIGGRGGESGAVPVVPTRTGNKTGMLAVPGPGSSGRGGDADAMPGTGGAGGFAFPGGDSGRGFARGGARAGGVQLTDVETPPVPAAPIRGSPGGVGVSAFSPGAP
jgi:hypothetical protein